MNYGLIAIYDNDSEYANCLANYFRLKGCLSSEIVVFTRSNSFNDFAKEHNIDILLIAEELLNTVEQLTLERNIFVLCNQNFSTRKGMGHYIYRYSSAEDILQETMASYEPNDLYPSISFAGKRTSEIIGVYSPLCRCGKTSFSMSLAFQYGMRSSCLLLSMDEFSTLRNLFDINSSRKTLDDLLYYYLQSPSVFESKLMSIVRHVYGIDLVPPFEGLDVFHQLSTNDWIRFIQSLADIGKYEYIIIDFGTASPVHPLFTLCNCLYVPEIHNDPYAVDKINLFKDTLAKVVPDNTIPIQFISLPYIPYNTQESDYLSQLSSGEIAQLAASIANQP